MSYSCFVFVYADADEHDSPRLRIRIPRLSNYQSLARDPDLIYKVQTGNREHGMGNNGEKLMVTG